MDPNARHRLAVTRIKMGDVDFVGSFFSEEVLDYSVLFGKTTDVYFEYEMYSEVKLSLSMNYCQYVMIQPYVKII